MNIENLRIATGTSPSILPQNKTEFLKLKDSLEVSLIDYPYNPYRSMFSTATATWGDNEYKDKWFLISKENKLEVIKAVLTHNTLPQAREMVNFVFRVRGVPRWLFDYHTQTKFTTFMSIGCRDNNKLDTDIIYGDKTQYASNKENEVFLKLKDLYKEVIEKGQGSWQSARTFLPQSYQHSYHFGQNLLSIASMKFDTDDLKSHNLQLIYLQLIREINKKFPLIGLYLTILQNNKDVVFNRIREIKFKDLDKFDKELFEEND